MKRVILRADDINAKTRPTDLQRVYGPCWDNGIPVCLSVIPRSACRFGATGPVPATPVDIRGHDELTGFLLDKYRAGLVEIALHGWQHRYGELAEGSVEEIRQRLESGLAALREALPGVPLRLLVPPYDHLSRAGSRAARQLGLGICSTWAAIHGETRFAHWWGRFRRWRGLSFAPARSGLWPTDTAVIDFEGHDQEVWSVTQRLLQLAERWDTPAVFVQHYWRLLDVSGVPNARYAQWLRWIDRMMACPDVHFACFSDG